MKIENSAVLATGAKRGIGLASARALLARGARKAFAPVLKANGGGALLNVLSVASRVNGGELAAQKTQVLGLHMAYVDTDLSRGFEVQKSRAEKIVRRALNALEAGADEVLAQQIRQGLAAPRPIYLPQAN